MGNCPTSVPAVETPGGGMATGSHMLWLNGDAAGKVSSLFSQGRVLVQGHKEGPLSGPSNFSN
jgi:hypothetical protein